MKTFSPRREQVLREIGANPTITEEQIYASMGNYYRHFTPRRLRSDLKILTEAGLISQLKFGFGYVLKKNGEELYKLSQSGVKLSKIWPQLRSSF